MRTVARAALLLAFLATGAFAVPTENRPYVVDATDCTALTDGVNGETCFEQDSNRLFVCETADVCNSAAEWVSVGTAPDVLNIKDYGALCDGATDDTAAIQAALDDALGRQVTGGVKAQTVYVPSHATGAECMISNTIYMGTGTKLLGQSRSGSTIKATAGFPTGALVPMIEMGTFHWTDPTHGIAQNAIIENLSLQGNNRAGVGVHFDGIEQGSGLRHVDINLGTGGMYGIYGSATGGCPAGGTADRWADSIIDDLNIEFTTAPQAGARGIYLCGGDSPQVFNNITFNGEAGANADSGGVELVNANNTTLTNMTGEAWGSSGFLVKCDSCNLMSFQNIEMGNPAAGAPTTLWFTLSANMTGINVRGIDGTHALVDTLFGYDSGANSSVPIYATGNLAGGIFINTTNGWPTRIGHGATSSMTCANTDPVRYSLFFDTDAGSTAGGTLCFCNPSSTNWEPVDQGLAGVAGASSTNCGT